MNKRKNFQPFDIVKKKYEDRYGKVRYAWGMVITSNGTSAAVEWFEDYDDLAVAWWYIDDLIIVNNAAKIIATEMSCYTVGNGYYGYSDVIFQESMKEDDENENEEQPEEYIDRGPTFEETTEETKLMFKEKFLKNT